jgi:hypothetical protein
MESVAIVIIVVVGIVSLGMAALGTYRNVNNPQAEVIKSLLEELERVNLENKTLRDYILILSRVAPVIPVPVSIINNQRAGGTHIDDSAVTSRDMVGGDTEKRDEITHS